MGEILLDCLLQELRVLVKPFEKCGYITGKMGIITYFKACYILHGASCILQGRLDPSYAAQGRAKGQGLFFFLWANLSQVDL